MSIHYRCSILVKNELLYQRTEAPGVNHGNWAAFICAKLCFIVLTLNQPRTHKCVQSLHKSIRIYMWVIILAANINISRSHGFRKCSLGIVYVRMLALLSPEIKNPTQNTSATVLLTEPAEHAWYIHTMVQQQPHLFRFTTWPPFDVDLSASPDTSLSRVVTSTVEYYTAASKNGHSVWKPACPLSSTNTVVWPLRWELYSGECHDLSYMHRFRIQCIALSCCAIHMQWCNHCGTARQCNAT